MARRVVANPQKDDPREYSNDGEVEQLVRQYLRSRRTDWLIDGYRSCPGARPAAARQSLVAVVQEARCSDANRRARLHAVGGVASGETLWTATEAIFGLVGVVVGGLITAGFATGVTGAASLPISVLLYS
jgi:hypothetical protein